MGRLEDLDQEIESKSAEIERMNQQVDDLQTRASGTDLVPSGGKAVKASLAALRADAIRQRQAIETEASNLKGLLDEKAALIRKQVENALEQQRQAARELERQLAPLQAMVKRAEEGIWTINLYFGRDEEIVTLLEGPTPELDEPIVIRQLVLAMDQEIAAAAEKGGLDAISAGGIDKADVVFDEWIKVPKHLQQVLPETRGVVALRPRFDAKIYYDEKGKEDPWAIQASEEAIRKTYFLIRNGGMLYRTWTDFEIPIHNLTPTTDEFVDFFNVRDRNTNDIIGHLEPGSDEWERAEEERGFRERHFMRVALILEGLLRRTAVFHPVHPDLSFTSMDSHKRGLVRIVQDAEALLTTGQPTFEDWQKENTKKARLGMRITGYFPHRFGDMRIRPQYSNPPDTGRIYTLDAEEGDDWVIRYDPPGNYRGRRSSYLLQKESDTYLVMDTAEISDMEYYLQSRLNRHAYKEMFPALRSAIQAKKSEFEREEPFRQMLAGVLARENNVTVEEAQKVIPDLVDWYKLSAKWHKALVFQDPPEVPEFGTEEWKRAFELAVQNTPKYRRPAEDEVRKELLENRLQRIRSNNAQESKAVKAIVAEHKSRIGATESLKETTIGDITTYIRTIFDQGLSEQALQTSSPLRDKKVILIGLRKDGRYVAFLNANDRNFFIHEVEFNRHGRMFTPDTTSKGGRYWSTPGTRPERNYQVLWTSDAWADWDRESSVTEFLTDPEYDQLKAEFHRKLPKIIEIFSDRSSKRSSRRAQTEVKLEYTTIGTYYDPDTGTFNAIVAPDKGLIPTSRLISTQADQPGYQEFVFKWEKGRRGVEFNSSTYPNQRVLGGYRGDEKPPWEEHKLWDQDEDAIRHLMSLSAHWKNYLVEKKALETLAQGYAKSVEQEWIDRAWARAHQKFIEDYMDESLWPDHKKSIRVEFPYKTLLYGSGHRLNHWRLRHPSPDTAFVAMIERLVEDHVQLGGVSIKDARELAKQHGIDDVEIPDDLLYLPFTDPRKGENEAEKVAEAEVG